MDTGSPDESGLTMTARAFNRLKADIVSGVLRPNQRLPLEEVSGRYNFGITPLREALTRLAALRLVVLDEQRGFRVAKVTLDDMRDVNNARQHLEVLLLGEAMEHGDPAWEERIVSAFHVLGRRASRRQQSDVAVWEAGHRDFHFALIDAARSPLLQSFHQITWDQACRYRLLGHAPEESDRLMEEHEGIMEAVLNREREVACALLRRHIKVWTERALTASFTALDDIKK